MTLKTYFFSMLCLGVSTAASAAKVELPDPGFEGTHKGWYISDSMSKVDATAARSGELGLIVVDEDAKAGSNVRSKTFRVKPGETYQVDFHAKVISGGGIAVYLQYFDQSGKLLGDREKATQHVRTVDPKAKDWTAYSLAGTAPENAAKMSVWIHSFAGNKVTAMFDDFTLQEVPAEAAKEHPSDQKLK